MTVEKREAKRLNLFTLNLFTLCPEDGQRLAATLRNLSVTGMLVEFFFEEPPVRLQPGERVVVRGVPEDLEAVAASVSDVLVEPCPERLFDLVCEAEASVVWVRGHECGLRFTEPLPLSTEALQEELARYGLPLWVEQSLEMGPQGVEDAEVQAWARAESESAREVEGDLVDDGRVPPDQESGT